MQVTRRLHVRWASYRLRRFSRIVAAAAVAFRRHWPPFNLDPGTVLKEWWREYALGVLVKWLYLWTHDTIDGLSLPLQLFSVS